MSLRSFTLVAALLASAGCGTSSSTESTSPAPTPETAGAETSARASAVASVTPSEAVLAAIAAPERVDADRALDEGRNPAQVLSFFGIAPGQRVAELFAGGGYTAELAGRVVGAEGRVYVQNPTWVLDRFARGPLEARLARVALPQLVAIESELDAPLPEIEGLDAVLFILAYHDSVWSNADRTAMNRAIFAALRPGGVYGIVDHQAAAGHGVDDTQTLHRIERDALIAEVEAAGFVLDGELDALRHAEDAHDWNASPVQAAERRGTSDRFVLRFVRPAE